MHVYDFIQAIGCFQKKLRLNCINGFFCMSKIVNFGPKRFGIALVVQSFYFIVSLFQFVLNFFIMPILPLVFFFAFLLILFIKQNKNKSINTIPFICLFYFCEYP